MKKTDSNSKHKSCRENKLKKPGVYAVRGPRHTPCCLLREIEGDDHK